MRATRITTMVSMMTAKTTKMMTSMMTMSTMVQLKTTTSMTAVTTKTIVCLDHYLLDNHHFCRVRRIGRKPSDDGRRWQKMILFKCEMTTNGK